MSVIEKRARFDQSPHERATAPASCILKSSGKGGASGSFKARFVTITRTWEGERTHVGGWMLRGGVLF